MRKFAALPASIYLRLKALKPLSKAGPVPNDDGDFGWTADTVYDEPREPVIQPTGVLDPRGKMLLRVIVPVKQQMGFNTGGNAWTGDALEAVENLVPEDMLSVSDGGLGVDHVSPAEVDEEDEPEGGAPAQVTHAEIQDQVRQHIVETGEWPSDEALLERVHRYVEERDRAEP